MAGAEGVRLSLAGAQDKLPVVVRGDRMALPLGNTASTHILKPEPDRLPGLAANELFCMTLARTIGLRVPAVRSRPVGDKACILIERYDRLVGADGVVTRLHQEDFCQALGFPPERKYQAEGGPLLRDCIGLLREWSTTPVLDIRDFVDGLIFNMLIGNADAHGKNFSMLYRGDERRLAPFYDLVCTLAWPELSKAPAMKIGGAESINEITPAHWRKMAQETRLGWPMIRDRLAELCGNAGDALQDPRVRNVAEDAAMTQRLVNIIAERGSSILRSLETK
jgi:serine/threonine-protein kinase HipA